MDSRKKIANNERDRIWLFHSSRVNSSQIPFEIYEAAYEEEPEEDR